MKPEERKRAEGTASGGVEGRVTLARGQGGEGHEAEEGGDAKLRESEGGRSEMLPGAFGIGGGE